MRVVSFCLVLAGCGSGAVSDPATAPSPPPLTVTPVSATAYPGVPTTFFISGGTGVYSVVSDNQGVVQNPNVSSGTFTVSPNPVAAQTKLTLTVRDASSSKVIPLTVEPIVTAKLAASPSTIAFQGNAPGTCASAIAADVLVYGGVPPYIASQPAGFTVNPPVVSTSPGRFTIFANGVCGTAQVAIVDSVGGSTSVALTNTLSAAPSPTVTDIAVAPTTVTLTSCSDSATVAIVGGSGHYFAVSGSSSVLAYLASPNTGIITRQKFPTGQQQTSPASVPIVFSDGASTALVTVTLPGGLSC